MVCASRDYVRHRYRLGCWVSGVAMFLRHYKHRTACTGAFWVVGVAVTLQCKGVAHCSRQPVAEAQRRAVMRAMRNG